jgi:hypothetical protein
MDQFIAKHADQLQGALSCFDRVLFRGYLPFFSGYAMASFLVAGSATLTTVASSTPSPSQAP